MATWSDIPLEVIEQIFPYMEDTSLIALSKLSHILNRLALQVYFRRNRVSGLSGGILSVKNPDPPKELVSTLCTALWVRLTGITYDLNPNVRRLFNELHCLTLLIERMPFIKCLRLSFTNFNARAIIHEIKSESWKRLISALLEATLTQGCQTIEIRGAVALYRHFDIPIMAYMNEIKPIPRPILIKPKLSVIKRLSLWIRRRVRIAKHVSPALPYGHGSTTGDGEKPNSPPIPITGHLPNSRLETFSLHSSVLLQPLFIPSTRSVLNNNASTIQEVQLINMADVTIGTWKTMFKDIHLPALRSFTYTSDIHILQPPELTFQLLIPFLLLHPTLTSLSLYGVLTPAVPSTSREHILPQLKVLDAHPRLISWLLQSQDQCPLLESVTITSECWSKWADSKYPSGGYAYFDRAISCVASLPRSIELQFKLSTKKGLETWINGHIQAGPRSVITQLFNVTHLTISCNLCTQLMPPVVALLPEWIRLFPKLRHVKFVEQLYLDASLLDAISCTCPRVTAVCV